MKMREAFEEIKKLAGERAAIAEFKMSTFDSMCCGLYIADLGWHHGDTWESALSKIMDKEVSTPPDEEGEE